VERGQAQIRPQRRTWSKPSIYRGLADNTVGKSFEALLRNDLLLVDEVGFVPLDDATGQLLFGLVAAYERRSLAIASHWSFEDWGRFLPEQHHCRQPSRPAARLPHRGNRRRLLPDETSPSERDDPNHNQLITRGSGDFQLATTGDHDLAIDTL
jgi:hypothetical protein